MSRVSPKRSTPWFKQKKAEGRVSLAGAFFIYITKSYFVPFLEAHGLTLTWPWLLDSVLILGGVFCGAYAGSYYSIKTYLYIKSKFPKSTSYIIESFKPKLTRFLTILLIISWGVVILLIYIGVISVNHHREEVSNCGQAISTKNSPLEIYAPCHDVVRTWALLPEGHGSGVTWSSYDNPEVMKAVYITTHLLSVKNNSADKKTIRNIHLKLYNSFFGNYKDLPTTNGEKTINLNHGEIAHFEIAYQYTFKVNKSPVKNITYQPDIFEQLYANLKEDGGKFGMLDIGRGFVETTYPTPIDELNMWGDKLTSELELTADDISSQFLKIQAIPNATSGFILKADVVEPDLNFGKRM